MYLPLKCSSKNNQNIMSVYAFVDDRKFKIEFEHQKHDQTLFETTKLSKRWKPYSKWVRLPRKCTCTIIELDGDQRIVQSIGFTVCSPDDPYDKSEGRIRALVDAVENGPFTPDESQVLYATYLNRYPNRPMPVSNMHEVGLISALTGRPFGIQFHFPEK